jgi:hypothetical protein
LSLLTLGLEYELATPKSRIFACIVKLLIGAPLSECRTVFLLIH